MNPHLEAIDNFGDLMTSQIFNSFTERQKTAAFKKIYIIGSILSQKLISSWIEPKSALVMGIGIGYPDFPCGRSGGIGTKFPTFNKKEVQNNVILNQQTTNAYDIAWVRGLVSSRLCGLPDSCALTDGAYLFRRTLMFREIMKHKHPTKISVFPHYTAARYGTGLKEACDKIKFEYIDPRENIETILYKIASSKLIITEALHGCIFSDIFRVPWIPFKTSDDILEIKWLDYFSSINKKYNPLNISIGWNIDLRFSRKNLFLSINQIFSIFRNFYTKKRFSPEKIAYQLLAASSFVPHLTSDQFISDIDAKMNHIILEKLGS